MLNSNHVSIFGTNKIDVSGECQNFGVKSNQKRPETKHQHLHLHQKTPAMSKKRGVSAQEKRDRLLTMLRESKRPWSTKEVEKSAKGLGQVQMHLQFCSSVQQTCGVVF